MKKIIAVVIALCLILNCGIISVFAAESDFDTVKEIPNDYDKICNEEISDITIPINAGDTISLNNTPEYVILSAETGVSRLEANDSNYRIHLNEGEQYDYIKVSFLSTENVLLNNYQTIKYDYSDDNKLVDIEFELNSDGLSLDYIPTYSETTFDKIYIWVDAYVDQAMVGSSSMIVSILNTEHGVFVSEYGDIYPYDNYISYLRTNSLISDEQYKLIQKKVTELPATDTSESMELIPHEMTVRYYDNTTNTVKMQTVREFSEIQHNNLTLESNSISLMSTTTSGSISAPSLSVTRTITALNSGDQLRIYGYVRWTDIEGNTHPARDIEVQIMDEDITFNDILATVYTSTSGYYSVTIDNQTGINENGCDIFIRVNTKNGKFSIGSNIVSSMFSDGYYFTTEVTSNVESSKSQVTYGGSNSDAFRAVSVQQALVVGYYYYESMNNDNVNSVSVVYPGGTDGSWSNSFWDLLNIEYNDYCDWDVILHELGHQVASKIGVSASFFDSHIESENLSERYGKSKGIKGAWSEGWASYFSMAAQLYYNRYVSTISNITNVADNTYTDLSFTDSDTTFSGWSRDYTTYLGYTDGNESAVTCVLLHLIIDSEVGLTHQEVWNIAKASGCDNFSEFVDTLYDTIDKDLFSAIGYHLERQNMADTPTVTTSVFSRNTPGTFYWDPALTRDGSSSNNNYVYYNQSKITFFDKNYNIVLQSPFISSSLGSYGTPINDVQWKALSLSIESGDPFYWCIATSQNDNPGTGPYYSTFHKAYFSEDLKLIENTNKQYSDYLNAYDDVVFMFVVPTSGYYAFSSIGDTDVNVTVYTNTVLEGKDIDNDDDGEGLNFLCTKYLSSGTTVYLKVGGYSSASGSFNVLVTKYTATTVNSSKSVTINGTDGVWYMFVAPTNGSYTFYTTGSIDVYGELFDYPIQNGSTSGRLIYDDDSGTGRNSLFTYNLTKNEVVYVRVRGYSSSITGSCTLGVVSTPVVSELDTAYAGAITANGYTVYKFTAPSAGDYTFYTTGNIDTYMDLFDNPVLNRTITANRLENDDDSGDSSNSSITYSMSRNQTVFIRVRGYSTSTAGDYGFTVVQSANVAELGVGLSGTLNSGSRVWYRFTASESGEYTFYTTGDVDTYGDALEFFAPDGSIDNLICSNDDDEDVDLSTLNFRLVLSLAAGETVYIRVRGYSTNSTGTFTFYADYWGG